MKNSIITRRQFLKAGTTAALGNWAGGNILAQERFSPRPQTSKAKGSQRRPNVLLIVVDDLNNSLVCYGHSVVKSPNIDRLAARGVRFDRAYCQFPICNPSRTSFLTGLRPDSTGILSNTVPFRSKLPDVVTLPQLFRKHGYFTARVGKVFHSTRNMDDPKSWNVTSYPKGTLLGKKGQGRNLIGGRIKWCRWLAASGNDLDQPDGQIAAEAVRLLEQHKQDPFFFAVGFHKPHDTFIAPKCYFDLYPLEHLKPPEDPTNRPAELPQAFGGSWKAEFDRFTNQERREFIRVPPKNLIWRACDIQQR